MSLTTKRVRRLAVLCGLALVQLVPRGFAGASEPTDALIVTVGVYENEPKVFTSETGRPAGIFIDVIEQIAKEEGWKLRYVPGTFAEGLERLGKGEIDLMPDVAYTAERERSYSFHRVPVLSSWSQVYARKGSQIRSILDLDGKRVAVLLGSVQQEAFTRLGESFGLEIALLPAPDYASVFVMVQEGKADAAVSNNLFGPAHADRYGLEDTAVVFSPSKLLFAARKDTPARMLDAIDRHLTTLKEDPGSVYYSSLRRWTSESVRFRLPAWARALGAGVLGILLLSVGGSAVLKRQVDVRTRELRRANKEMERRVVERTADLARAMEEARAADRTKSAFLATMSHELRTPLNSIIGFSGILLEGLAGPLNPEQTKQLTMVESSSRHLLSLINDILDISKIEAGQLDLASAPFDAGRSIGAMIEAMAPLAERKGIELQSDLAESPGTIRTDQRRFEQVVLNLVGNAVKFTETGRVRVSCRGASDQLLVTVSDTGIGIPPGEIPRLFEPFHQVDAGIARKREGTGLGLSICKKIVEMMGGHIDVQSQVGRGSTFSVRLPRRA